MINPAQGRPPYRLAFCPRAEAAAPEGAAAERFSGAELAELATLPERRLRDRVA